MIRPYSADYLDEKRLKRIIHSFSEEFGSHKEFYSGGWFNMETYDSFNRRTDDFIVDLEEKPKSQFQDFRGFAIGVKRSRINYDIYICYVSPENRRKGIMSFLMSHLEQRAIQRQCKNLNTVVVPENNIASLNFHRTHGFIEKKSTGCVEFTKQL